MSSRVRPVAGALTFAGTFLAAVLSSVGGAAAAERPPSAVSVAPRCDEDQALGDDPAYEGPSISALYDRLFAPGPALPYLRTHVPQALKAWRDWDGQGHDLLLQGEYRTGEDSYLIGIDPKSGHALGTVRVAASHLGGMVLIGGWLLTGDNPWPHPGSPTVTPYRLSDLRAAMRQAMDTGELPYLAASGPRQDIDSTDFMVVDGHSVYAGNHGNPGSGHMYRYVLRPGGRLVQVEGPWSVPPRGQGMIVTPDDFIFASDNGVGRGSLTAVRRRDPGEDSAPIGCIWIPPMPEDMDVYGGRLLISFESGTAAYAHIHPRNHITHLHEAPLAGVVAVLDPAEAIAEPTPGGLLPAAATEAGSLVLRAPLVASPSAAKIKPDAMGRYEAQLRHVDHLLRNLRHPADH